MWSGGTPPYFLSLIPGEFVLPILVSWAIPQHVEFPAGQVSAPAVSGRPHAKQTVVHYVNTLGFTARDLPHPERHPADLDCRSTGWCNLVSISIIILFQFWVLFMVLTSSVDSNLALKDSTGAVAYSDIVTVQTSTDKSCLGSSSNLSSPPNTGTTSPASTGTGNPSSPSNSSPGSGGR